MRLLGKYYPAHSSNYTIGRNRKIKHITIHHTAANNTTLRYLWKDPDRNGSSHFGVFKGYSEQYVDTKDTAWTNGNWESNMESITIEVTGDWRFGYKDQRTLDSLTDLIYLILKKYPDLTLNYHKDVSKKPTVCPADLKDKGYARDCYTTAKKRIDLENGASGLRVDIKDKKVILIRDANVWDMNFKKFSEARSVARLKKGTVVDVAGVYDHSLSKTDYYLSKYSWDKGLDNGISRADVKDYKPVVKPQKPKPPAKPPAQDKPETQPETPVGGQGPQDPEYPTWFIDFIKKVVDAILNIIRR